MSKRPSTKKTFKQSFTKSIHNLFGGLNDPAKLKNIAGDETSLQSNRGYNANRYNSHDSIHKISSSTPTFHQRLPEPDFESEIKSLISESHERNSVPIIYLHDINEYAVEGYAVHQEPAHRPQTEYVSIEHHEIIETNREYKYYSNYFYCQEHFDYFGKTQSNEDFILSIKFHPDSSKLTCILRTKDGNTILSDINLREVTLHKILNKFSDSLAVKEIKPVLHPQASKLIVNYDSEIIKTKFTFGIIYQKFGQANEKEIFDNQQNSVEFNEFLNFIGNRIKLKNFPGFKGGLDITSDDTGQESIYANYDNSEIMFHVSTLLPHSNRDTQQIERKRHIGNDRVAIVFQDEGTPFCPTMIKSKLLHVFVIVQPIMKDGETDSYQLSVLSRKDVPYFGPFIEKPFVFKKNEIFKNFLLTKLINAEYSSLKAPAFSQFSEKTLRHSLSKLCDTLRDSTNRFNDSEIVDIEGIDIPRAKSPSISTQQSSQTNSSISKIRSVVSRLKPKSDEQKAFQKSFKKTYDSSISDDSAAHGDLDRKTSKESYLSKESDILTNNLEDHEANTLFEIQSNKSQSDADDQKSINKSLDDIDESKQAFRRVGLIKFSRKIHERFHSSADDKQEQNS